MSPVSPRLMEAVEEAYRAFGRRELKAPLEVCHCPCCMVEEIATGILATPLRELSNEQLSEYANSAHGWSDQFPYLLPRIMELVSQGVWPSYLDAGHVLSRFTYAPENALTAEETAALGDWLTTLFEDTLTKPISAGELADALAGRSSPWESGMGGDVCDVIELALPTPFDTRRLQSLWIRFDGRESTLRFAVAKVHGIADGRFRADRYRPESTQAAARLWHEWFTQADHGNWLVATFERETDPDVQELLLAAMSVGRTRPFR